MAESKTAAAGILRIMATDFHRDWGGQAAVVHLLCRHWRAAGSNVAVAAPAESELKKRCHEDGLATIDGLQFLPGFRPWAFWRDLGILRRHLCAFNPHIIHVHGSQDSWLAALANRGSSAAVVKTKHNTMPVRRHIFNRWLYRSLCRACVAVSAGVKETLTPLLPPEQIDIIPAPVAEEFFMPPPTLDLRSELQLPAEALLIGQVARLAQRKGQDVLIAAAPLVLAHMPLARFVIVGTGEEYHRLHNEIRNRGLAHHVFLLGFRRDVAAVMANFQVLALPSLAPEGSPVAIKEAMALGVPVIASNLGGNTEIVEHDVNGLLVPASDPKALAEALIALLGDRQRATRLAANARQMVRERFRASIIAAQYLALFQRIAAYVSS